jgi:hypothetical protein
MAGGPPGPPSRIITVAQDEVTGFGRRTQNGPWPAASPRSMSKR